MLDDWLREAAAALEFTPPDAAVLGDDAV